MSGLWFLSYAALWVAVVLLALLQLGTLRQLGALRQMVFVAGDGRPPSYEEDGPAISSPIPGLVVETANGRGRFDLQSVNGSSGTLLMFMAPLCEGCHDIVEPLNALADNPMCTASLLVVLSGDAASCRSFLNVFPLRLPVVLDTDQRLARDFSVHHRPYGLLYDLQGVLVRKGSTVDADGLAALLGDSSVPEQALAQVFPRPDLPAERQPIDAAISSPG